MTSPANRLGWVVGGRWSVRYHVRCRDLDVVLGWKGQEVSDMERLADWMNSANAVTLFSGAGMSTEVGAIHVYS